MLRREPSYYKKFACLAGKCRDNCCRVGWDIALDDEAYKRYLTLPEPLRKKALATVSKGEDGELFIAHQGGCPMLDKNGLCSLVLSQGEDFLGYICRTHPRFENDYGEASERGVGLACEEAARLIMTEGNPSLVDFEKGEVSGELSKYFTMRKKISKLVFESENLYSAIAGAVYYAENAAGGAFGAEIKPAKLSKTPNFENIAKLAELLSGYERLEPEWGKTLGGLLKKLPERGERCLENGAELARIFNYFMYRYFVAEAIEGDMLFGVKLAAAATVVLRELFFKKSQNERIMLAHDFSKELEYSDENMDALRLDMFVYDIFETDELVEML